MTTRHHPSPPQDDFNQLHGMLDAPIAPSPRFAEHLRAQVHERAAIAATTAGSATEGPAMSIAKTPPLTTVPPHERHLRNVGAPHRPRRFASALAGAILVLVITGLVIGLARLSPNAGKPNHHLAGQVIATPTTTASTASGAVNWGGDAGHTGSFDLPGFGNGQVTIGQGGENSGFANRQAAISNGSIIVTQHWKQSDADSTFLEAFSLKGTSFWQVDIGAMPGMAIDGERLYLIRDARDALTAPVSRHLTAISLETGDVLWTGPEVGSSGKATWGWSPVVAGNTVYIADGTGSAYAVDAATGKTRWESLVPDDAVPDRADGSSVTKTGGSIALGDGTLWVAGWTNTIRKLDPESGELLATITLDEGLQELDLYLRDTALVARANQRTIDTPTTSVLVTIDTTTNAIRWTQGLPVRVDDNLVVLADRVIVPRVDDGEIPTLNADGYMLATGERRSIPMPMLETSMASLAAIDGPTPLLLIVSQDGTLTIVNGETGDVVGHQPSQVPSDQATYRPLPILLVGGETPIVAQPNGSWFRIIPG
ncbi:MAG: PQQ-binding-like beta-propeller repeat protein [Thermomicrobiales bacterium]